jgi:hypothetical protein
MGVTAVLSLVFISLLLVDKSQGQTHEAAVYGIAIFNIRGVRGYIKFMPNPNDTMTIIVSII